MLVYLTGPRTDPDPGWERAAEISLKRYASVFDANKATISREARVDIIRSAVAVVCHWVNSDTCARLGDDLEIAFMHQVPVFVNVVDRLTWENVNLQVRLWCAKKSSINACITEVDKLVKVVAGGSLKVSPVDPEAFFREPTRAYQTDCGYDLYVSGEHCLKPFETANVYHNLRLELPYGTWGHMVGRSSAFHNRGFQVMTGVIDNGYRGPIFATVTNLSGEDRVIPSGDRVIQLILVPMVVPDVLRVKELSNTDRGQGGLGSTGR